MRIRRRFRFEAAHYLPRHAGKCRELHGHSYRLVVNVERPVDTQSGMALDFSEIKEVVRREVIERLDHRCVNDLMENPTAELMTAWIWQRLASKLPGLCELELHETDDCSVLYRGE